MQARTAAAADSALAGLRGGIGAQVAEIRAAAIELLAELEARIDFDEDMHPMDLEGLTEKVAAMQVGGGGGVGVLLPLHRMQGLAAMQQWLMAHSTAGLKAGMDNSRTARGACIPPPAPLT